MNCGRQILHFCGNEFEHVKNLWNEREEKLNEMIKIKNEIIKIENKIHILLEYADKSKVILKEYDVQH